MSGQDWLEKDFYASLGVPKDADAAAIKKAYRKLARTHHPDQNAGDPQAETRFKEIGEAYAVLSDPEQRQQYDALRAMAGGGPRFASGPGGATGFEDLFGGMFSGGGAPGGRGAGGPRVRYSTGGGGGPDIDDLLGGLFGGGGGFGRGGAEYGPVKGRDLTASATLPFRQAVAGDTVGLVVNGRSTKVRIPPGVKDGQKIRVPGRGEPGPGGGPAGDLVVTVTVEPHPVFGISGDNLTITVPVSFPEAVDGAVISVPTLDGGSVRLKVPAGTSSGARLRVKGKGVTTKRGTGDLIVTIEVAVPRNLSDGARAALNEFAAATAGEDPRVGLAEAARS
ncbi:DnaJ C-terminal domain-containing protein [Pseudactinotalea suaedae]|jgi:molecular chaperone DnaJ|uniref:DnaJ C-terminal domain-containing protein n=1 Tax=Pseudactinotalea suaedae TaxID=1524924 RepID=UPI0012E28444|nr:DnaJ C-terminal domain-containing protein [Pseudactinotalea suaedae]